MHMLLQEIRFARASCAMPPGFAALAVVDFGPWNRREHRNVHSD